MSIQEQAISIMVEAREHMRGKYHNYFFDLNIGRKHISLKLDWNMSLAFRRWDDELHNHHLYTLDLNEMSWQFAENTQKINDALRLAEKYMKIYADYKKMDGYLIVLESKLQGFKEIDAITPGIDHMEFNDEEKGLIPHFFSKATFSRYLGGKTSEELQRQVKQAVPVVQMIKEKVEGNPLLRLENLNVKNLMGQTVVLDYHGEQLSTYINHSENEVEVMLRNLNVTKHYPMPFEERDFQKLLEEVEENNKLKNLLEPSHPAFNSVVGKALGVKRTDTEFFNNQFDKLVEHYGKWETVETIFVNLLKHQENRGMEKTELAVISSPISDQRIDSFSVTDGEHTFFFVKHASASEEDERKIFPSENGKAPEEFKNYINQWFKQTFEKRLKDSHLW